MSPYGVIKQQWDNSSLHEQNGHYFTENIFKCISLNEKFCILIWILLKFVPKGPIDNNPVLTQVIAWHQAGDNPFPEPVLSHFTDAYMRP